MTWKPSDEGNLEHYFTNVEYLRALFASLLTEQKLEKRVLIIYGVGGVGKTSLLRMLRIQCRALVIGSGLASAEESRSPTDILSSWRNDFAGQKIRLRELDKALGKLRSIQLSIEKHAQKDLGDSGHPSQIAGKIVVKTVEGASGAFLGAAIGSLFPIAGTIIGAATGAVVGTTGETLLEWLQGFLKETDIETLRDPTEKLTNAFLKDLESVSQKQRLVLFLDAIEQTDLFSDWISNLCQKLPENIAIVLAGRNLPNWSRSWENWLTLTYVEELKTMVPETMQELVRRYFSVVQGSVPTSVQVNEIVRFSRGLPIVASTAIQLCVQYGIEDFSIARPQVLADLIERIFEGVPETVANLIQAAASLRWFNQEILSFLVARQITSAEYNELRKMPFVLPHRRGFMIHEALREIIDENLELQYHERYRFLHSRAQLYFETQMRKVQANDANAVLLETLFHSYCVDAEEGVRRFAQLANSLLASKFIFTLQTVINDGSSYISRNKNGRKWIAYFQSRLMQFQARLEDAERSLVQIIRDPETDNQLRTIALRDLGKLLSNYEKLGEPDGIRKAIETLQASLNTEPISDDTVESLFSLARVARYEGAWEQEFQYLERAREHYVTTENYRGLILVSIEQKRAAGRRGLWKNLFEAHDTAARALSKLPTEVPTLKAELLGLWAWAFALAGHYSESERHARISLEITKKTGNDVFSFYTLRDLGWITGFQGKFRESEAFFSQSLKIASQMGNAREMARGRTLGYRGRVLINMGKLSQAEALLRESLKVHENSKFTPGTLDVLNWLALALEIQRRHGDAQQFYHRHKEWDWYQAFYATCTSIVGLARVAFVNSKEGLFYEYSAKAVELGLTHYYHDHLAVIRLLEGHFKWRSDKKLRDHETDDVLTSYKNSLVHALRYNRFLLDDILWGDRKRIPFEPLIPYCLSKGVEGKMLLSNILEWWQGGTNALDCLPDETVSSAPADVSLIEAEKIARLQEYGNREIQINVIDAIRSALRD